ncbi:MAG TPA: hypothetical protein VNN22_04935 [Verrucomicrobiae bacterium]|nr:hypothetical protein [Verrucomicrobiae bacterium]
MYHNYKHLAHSCRPLTIARDDQPQWGKIGGYSPQGVEPPVITESTRYFATLKTGDAEQTELSLFISMDYELTSPNSLWKNQSMMHSKASPLVQFVFHKPLPRGENPRFASELSGLGLIIEEERADSDDPEKNIIWNHHKIGGYPFFARSRNSIFEQSKALLQDGYWQLAQFSFPDAQDGPVSGRWPFTAFVFHVFTKDASGQIDFRYCWG